MFKKVLVVVAIVIALLPGVLLVGAGLWYAVFPAPARPRTVGHPAPASAKTAPSTPSAPAP